MIGKSLYDFIDDLYHNPEFEILFCGKRYTISGYTNSNNTIYTLEVYSISDDNMVFIHTDSLRERCVEQFEEAKIFDGKTIYEVEKEIKVLYG